MTNSEQTGATGKGGPAPMVSPATRAIVAAGVVLATATSVWVAEAVSSSPLPGIASATEPPAPRLASALPTVTIVGRRGSLESRAQQVLPEHTTALASLTGEDVPSGRVNLRQ